MSHQTSTIFFDTEAALDVWNALNNCVDNGYEEDLKGDVQEIINSLIEHGVVDPDLRYNFRLRSTISLWKRISNIKENKDV